MARERTRPALLALLAAAAALDPALLAAQDETTREGFSYRYQDYDEDALDEPNLGEDTSRYTVATHQFRVAKQLDDDTRLVAEGLSEAMSGSSPWFVLPDPDGDPVQVMSGATIRDDRHELAASLRRESELPAATEQAPLSRAQTWRATWSDEDDYESVGVGYERERALDAQGTLTWGLSAAFDRIEPTDAELYLRVERERKRSYGAFASYTRVLNRNAQLQAGISLDHGRGFLSDPYKQVFVVSTLLPDTRPDMRTQAAAIVRYRHAVTARAALHLDYRLARDDWGVVSHALEARWLHDLGRGFELAPGVRYYSQSAADFYAPFHTAVRADEDYSSDYRLGEFGAWSLSLALRKQWKDFTLTLGAERYESASATALGSTEVEVPALVDFTRFTLGFDYRY